MRPYPELQQELRNRAICMEDRFGSLDIVVVADILFLVDCYECGCSVHAQVGQVAALMGVRGVRGLPSGVVLCLYAW